MNSIADELRIGQAKEGLPDLLLTGRIELDVAAQRCWFEVLDDGYNVTSWVTADAPQLAAHGETLCAAASLEEALMLGQD
jgi:hypothetical protein